MTGLTSRTGFGFDLADPDLAAAVKTGLERVEKLLHDELRSELDFITQASLHLVEAGGKRFRPLFTLLAAQFGDGETAVSRARDALDVLGEHHEIQQGSAWWALAEGQALKGDVAASNDAFRRAVDLLDRNSQWREAAQCCRRWAKVLRDAGRDADALDALERATDYAVRSQPTSQARLER
jgi:ATP/maltotriose-dependent transcriptional regulator MalT